MTSNVEFSACLAPTAPIANGERRGSPRLRTVYRVARVTASGDRGLARVLNLSDEGIMLGIRITPCIGDTLVVDLSETCSVSGKVIWHMAGRCGLKLDDPIDSAAVLRRLYEEKSAGVTRQLRVPIKKAATVFSEAGLQVAQVRDVSQAGVKLVHNGQLRRGMQIKVQFSPDLARRGIVRWSTDALAGVALMEPISVEQLGSAAHF